ncbi:FAD-dependent oxidoreductase [Kytococcus sp. Marseille-QA3725]
MRPRLGLVRVPLRPADADVIVIGAGMAGLTAAAELTAAGRHVEVLEADVTVGGRVGSALVDGFTVDHGLHLLRADSPGLSRHLDLELLALQPLDEDREVLADVGPEGAVLLREPLGDHDPTGLLGTPAGGRLALPGHGMVGLPVQLAGRLEQPVRTENHVESVRRRGGSWVVVGDHGTWSAPQVVFATPPQVTADLLHGSRVELPGSPGWQGASTWWFTCAERPAASRALRVDGRQVRGPVVATLLVSQVAPGYSGGGRPLVAAVVPHPAGGPAGTEAAVRVHLSELWDGPAFDWEVVAHQEDRWAVPDLGTGDPGDAALTPTSGLVLVGDHRRPGIEGAMASGAAGAELLLAESR